MKNEKDNICCIFSGKYGKMSKKVKNDEAGSDIAEKGPNWWKMNKIIFFWIFSGKYGKMSKNLQNDEEVSDMAEKGPNWCLRKSILCFGFFQKTIEKCRKKWKIMKTGQILLTQAQIDEK